MKNNQSKLLLSICIYFFVTTFVFAQEAKSKELHFEVNRVYPYIFVTKEDIKEAKTLADINRHYKPSWVRDFISVEIVTCNEGEIVSSITKSDTLSQAQKERMNTSDAGTAITIKVNYFPENTLIDNEPKEYDFTFTLDPEKEAVYPKGQQELMNYLKEKAIAKIPVTSLEGYDLVAIKFTVSETGEVANAHIFGSEYRIDEEDEVSHLLLETIRSMPDWQPAEHANGRKEKQEWVLTVGNMENCIIPLLSINRSGVPWGE